MKNITQLSELKVKCLPLPTLAIVPLKVAGEKASTPIIKLNQIVKKGECIATANNNKGVNIFSPIYGKVVGFDLYPLSNRENAYCVFIENLDSQEVNIDDSILKAKLDAMKKSIDTKLKENRYNLDENKLHSGDFMQDSVEKLQNQEIDENIINDRNNALQTMFSSNNSQMDFNLQDLQNNAKDKKEEIVIEQTPQNNLDDKEKSFLFTPYDNEENLLAYINKCAVLSQNGENLSELLKQDKKIIVPCFDAKQYAFENMAVLVNHFDEIYQALEVVAEKLDKQIILLYKKGDQLPDMQNEWAGQTQKGIYKLCVKTTNAKSILKSHFDIMDESNTLQDYEALNNHFCVFSPTSIYMLFKAIKQGQPQTTKIITIGGKGLTKNGVYEVPSGCTLEHIQKCLGGTTSEQDIEDEKNDAMDAVSEYYEYLEQYKQEKDQTKKKEMKTSLILKKKLANKLTKQYVKTAKKKVKSCLGQIVFDDIDNGETHGNFQAVCELKNNRLYYLSVSQC